MLSLPLFSYLLHTIESTPIDLQMCILSLFNTVDALTFDAIVSALQPSSAQRDAALVAAVAAALLSLTTSPHMLLTCSTVAQADFCSLSSSWVNAVYAADALFRVNASFSSTARVIHLHRVLTSVESLTSQDREALSAYRRSVIDASIMQVLKFNTQLEYAELVRRVRVSIAHRYDPFVLIYVWCHFTIYCCTVFAQIRRQCK